MKRIAVVPGDGIGVDVTREAVKVLERAQEVYGFKLELNHFDWSADKYLSEGVTMPEGAFDMLRNEYDAIYVGAFGDPRVPDMKHADDILLGMRYQLDLFMNFRPVKLLHDSLTPLKGRTTKDIDFVVFRENTEGMYTNVGGVLKRGTAEEVAIQVDTNTRLGVERIIVAAFEYAKKTGRKSVTMVDKSNVLKHAHSLWQRTFAEVAARYAGIESSTQFVDACTMWMVLKPEQYEVIVTNNMFGDIITDLGAALQGGLGIASSGNIHPGKVSLFEPVHGSAPKYAGKNITNPIGAVLSAGLMLDYVGQPEAAKAVEAAVVRTIEQKQVTRDLGGSLGTREAGDAICAALK